MFPDTVLKTVTSIEVEGEQDRVIIENNIYTQKEMKAGSSRVLERYDTYFIIWVRVNEQNCSVRDGRVCSRRVHKMDMSARTRNTFESIVSRYFELNENESIKHSIIRVVVSNEVSHLHWSSKRGFLARDIDNGHKMHSKLRMTLLNDAHLECLLVGIFL